MATVKTAISLPAETFAAVSAAAAEKKISRSALVLEAIQEYLRRAESEMLLEQINAAYGDADDRASETPIDWRKAAWRAQSERLRDDRW